MAKRAALRDQEQSGAVARPDLLQIESQAITRFQSFEQCHDEGFLLAPIGSNIQFGVRDEEGVIMAF